MPNPRISLEQWQALVAVVDADGYARAAEKLHKSQSAVTYAVQKLERLLDVKAFEIRGRKAVLTPTGQMLYLRARTLLDEAASVERSARTLSAGWEAGIGLAVEILFPTWLVLDILARFGAESPHTRIELVESVRDGTNEALLQGKVDLAITPLVPPGFLGDLLLRMPLVLAAHPQHPLHQLGRPLTLRDLRMHRQLVVRDTGSQRTARSAFLEARQRWTVSNMSSSIIAARAGYGFAWYPQDKIRDELAAGTLRPLPLREGGERAIDMYLVYADREAAGPGVRRLAELIRAGVAGDCAAHAVNATAAVPPA
ncbi:MAG TPA: LysR family transcriptional regulator [Pseudomonadota bacterium]|nr:LysR family transcriptional regulator [Pseudomonadota bacterium]